MADDATARFHKKRSTFFYYQLDFISVFSRAHILGISEIGNCLASRVDVDVVAPGGILLRAPIRQHWKRFDCSHLCTRISTFCLAGATEKFSSRPVVRVY